jgi:hypothetical protein
MGLGMGVMAALVALSGRRPWLAIAMALAGTVGMCVARSPWKSGSERSS